MPPPLQRGDVVALAATARKVSPQEVESTVALLQSAGLEVSIPQGLYSKCNQLAGTDSHRAGLLQQLLDDSEVKAILCCRGGYGTVRIIDSLDFGAFQKRPKWLVGYSDVTVLHSHIHRHCGIATLHGIMPLNIDAETTLSHPAVATLCNALFERQFAVEAEQQPLNREGEADGVLVGGNLSILYSLCGSPSAIDTRGKILFIEDLDEYLYHIDRMMQNLKRNGMLGGLAGLVVGAMSDMHDNAIPYGKTAEEIIREAVDSYNFPVAFGLPCGHIGTDNQALILGAHCHLKVGDRTQLTNKV